MLSVAFICIQSLVRQKGIIYLDHGPSNRSLQLKIRNTNYLVLLSLYSGKERLSSESTVPLRAISPVASRSSTDEWSRKRAGWHPGPQRCLGPPRRPLWASLLRITGNSGPSRPVGPPRHSRREGIYGTAEAKPAELSGAPCPGARRSRGDLEDQRPARRELQGHSQSCCQTEDASPRGSSSPRGGTVRGFQTPAPWTEKAESGPGH